jgi:hypothetical protein
MAFDKNIFAQLGAPSVTLTLAQGGFSVDLKVCFDMKAIGLVKQKLGVNMFVQNELKTVAPSDWPTILWAGLQRYQGNLSVDEVALVMNPGNFQLVVEKCLEAFTITLPKELIEADADPKTETVTEPVPAQA